MYQHYMRDFSKLVDYVKWVECIVRWNTVEGVTAWVCSKGLQRDENQSAFGNMDDSLGSEANLTEGRNKKEDWIY